MSLEQYRVLYYVLIRDVLVTIELTVKSKYVNHVVLR